MRLFLNVTTGLSILMSVFTITFPTQLLAETPDLQANKDERSLSNPAYILGQHWFRKLNGSRALIDYPPAYGYLKDTLARILPQTNLYNRKVEMTLLNSSKSNAFVIPGSHLFIYSDIMEMITNEEMLFGLLSHEVAHLDLRHYERQSQHSGEELQKTLLLLGAGIAAALAGGSSDTSAALWLGGIANQANNTLTYSRSQEQEADRKGRQYLKGAGLPEESMSELFQAFFKKSLGRPNLEFLSTHPSPNTRLSDSMSLETKDSILLDKTKSDFNYFRATILSYRAGLEDNPYQYLDQQLHDEDVRNYAKALFTYLIQSPDKSLMYLSKLNSENYFTSYLHALSFIAMGETEKSLNIVRQQRELNPDSLIFSMLNTQLSGTKPADIEQEYLYENRLIWRTNIQYYKDQNNIPMALNYRAKLDFSQGKDKTAQILIRRAIKDAESIDMNKLEETKKSFEIIRRAEEQEDIEGEK